MSENRRFGYFPDLPHNTALEGELGRSKSHLVQIDPQPLPSEQAADDLDGAIGDVAESVPLRDYQAGSELLGWAMRYLADACTPRNRAIRATVLICLVKPELLTQNQAEIARELGVSRAAISKQIGELRQHLGECDGFTKLQARFTRKLCTKEHPLRLKKRGACFEQAPNKEP